MKAPLSVVLGLVTGAVGCAPAPDIAPSGNVRAEQRGDLRVSLEVPSRFLLVGQTVPVTVTAENRGTLPIRGSASSGAPVYVRVRRNVWTGWDVVKSYPESAIAMMRPWTLTPGRTKRWVLHVPVEPDWPTHEDLRLTAELNGREDASPGVTVRVLPPGEPAAGEGPASSEPVE